MADQIHELSRWEDRPAPKGIDDLLRLMDARPGQKQADVRPSIDGEMLDRFLKNKGDPFTGFVFHLDGCGRCNAPEAFLNEGAFRFVWEHCPGRTCSSCRRRLDL